MLVAVTGFGSVWRRRFSNNEHDSRRFARGAYFNATGVTVNGQVRQRPQIKVTSERSGLELAYRRSYFATEESRPSGDEAAKTLAASLQPGMPPATSILIKVRVLPPDAAHKATRVDYAIESARRTEDTGTCARTSGPSGSRSRRSCTARPIVVPSGGATGFPSPCRWPS